MLSLKVSKEVSFYVSDGVVTSEGLTDKLIDRFTAMTLRRFSQSEAGDAGMKTLQTLKKMFGGKITGFNPKEKVANPSEE